MTTPNPVPRPASTNAAWRRLASARMAKLVAVSYLVKTLLVGVAWLTVPDFTERAVATVRAAWHRVAQAAD